MYKRSFISFVILLAFFIVISGVVDLQHVIVGVFLCLITLWFWKDITRRLPRIFSLKELLLFCRSILMLIGYVIQSNIDVAKIMLLSDLSSGSIFLELEPDINTEWGRVFLATCITITPGTITIDFNPDTNVFTIHALTMEMGQSLYYWRLITEIKNLEKLIQRGETHVLDSSGIHDTNSLGLVEGNHRANSN